MQTFYAIVPDQLVFKNEVRASKVQYFTHTKTIIA
jgi:hypothetical protein